MLPAEAAVQRVHQELHHLYLKITGKEADPEVLRAEAEAIVAKYGPAAELKDMFRNLRPANQ